MDKVSEIINNFSISADVIFSGSFCGEKSLGSNLPAENGHIHFLRSGVLTVLSGDGQRIVLDKPSVIVLPHSTFHQILSAESEDVDLVCASIRFETAGQRQLIEVLPKFIYFTLEDGPMAETAQWLFAESIDEALGRKAIVDKLCDIFLIQMLRHLVKEGLVIQGMLAGLAHPKLAKTISLIQESPHEPWTLDTMAASAAMSRSKFAALFKETLGQPPNDYLIDLRVSIAQELLKEDKSVSFVANSVGYEHGSALARVFRKKTGLSPKEWLQKIYGVERL